MKKYLSFILFTALTGAFSWAQNPISPAGVYIADPTARLNPDGKLYIYGSLDMSTAFYCSTDYHVLSTSDLKHWTLHPNSFSSPSQMPLFAPDMIHANGKYYLYYDTPDGAEGVAESTSPTGPFQNGQQIAGARGIDPNVFIDDDGQAYYFWGQFSAKGAKLMPDMKTIDQLTVVDGIVTEAEHHFHEGGFVFKRGKYYYYTFADISRQNRPTCIGYAMSESVFGPYEYKGVIIDNAGCDPCVWNNHGSVVEFEGNWYVLYHRPTHRSQMMRKACIEPITFNPDGTINEVEMTSQGAAGPLNAFDKIEARRACLLNGQLYIDQLEGQPEHEVVTHIHPSDRAGWKYLDFGKGATKLTLRVRGNAGGVVNVGIDQSWNESIGSLTVPASGNDWVTLTCDLKKVEGVHALWLNFSNLHQDNPYGSPSNPDEILMEIDWLQFE